MQLGVWIQTQRAVFNGKARGNLTDEQVNALNAIGMEWGSVLDSAWNETWKLAKEYYEANGNLLVPDSFQIGGIDLGKWTAYQRSRKKNGRLSAERVAKLNEIGMVWDTVNSRWEQRYAQAKRYFDKKGNLDIPSSYRCEDGFLLGMWVASQRKAKTGANKSKRLTAEQIDRLTAIGMDWGGTQEARWQNAYRRAEEYYQQNGNLNIPYAYCTEDGYRLGRWLARQKDAGRKSGNCVMTPERVAKLEKIGIVWDVAR